MEAKPEIKPNPMPRKQHEAQDPKAPAAAAPKSDEQKTKDVAASRNEDADEEEEDEEEEEEEEGEEERPYEMPDETIDDMDLAQYHQPIPARQFEAIGDFQGSEPGDLSFKRGDIFTILAIREDGWWLAQAESGLKGLVPSTYLKVHSKYEEVSDQQLASESMDVKPTAAQGQPVVTAADSTMAKPVEGFPEGFRMSYLSKALIDNLFWNSNVDKLRKRNVKILKIVRLLQCLHIPPLDQQSGATIQNRFVRICLFDGANVLSNVHTIKAQFNPSRPSEWRFMHKNSNEVGYVCCGWATVPLFLDAGTMTGQPSQQQQPHSLTHIGHRTIENKIYNVNLKGGTPFDQGLADARINSLTLRQKLGGSGSRPHLVVRVSPAKASQKLKLDTLPDTLICDTEFIDALAYYRRLLGAALIKDNVEIGSSDLLWDPVIALFPVIIDQPDIMDTFRQLEAVMSLHFKDVFLQTAVAIYDTMAMPPYNFGQPENIKLRKELLEKFLTAYQTDHSPLRWLSGNADPNATYLPFDPMQYSFDIAGKHCLI